ncbi:MAG: hypothetical protein EXR21_06320 [Flavobacteriaceae bacterium]|nr:hypothetical protein [Flavobacteriaceae bacterium]
MNKFFSIVMFSTIVAIAGCGKKSDCTTSNCLNGGTCVDGKCECPIGFTGDCSQEKVPTSMTISKFVCTKFPGKNNGVLWDNLSGGKAPDIYITFSKNGASSNLLKTNYYSDADTAKYYGFQTTAPITVASPTEQHDIFMFDDDTPNGEEIMDFVSFIPYQAGKKFPTQYTIISESKAISIDVYCTYTW